MAVFLGHVPVVPMSCAHSIWLSAVCSKNPLYRNLIEQSEAAKSAHLNAKLPSKLFLSLTRSLSLSLFPLPY